MSASPWPQITRNIWTVLHYHADHSDPEARYLAELITGQVRGDIAAYQDMRAFAAEIQQDLDAIRVATGHEGCGDQMPGYDGNSYTCGGCGQPVEKLSSALRPVAPS